MATLEQQRQRHGNCPAEARDIRRTGIHPDHWYPAAWSSDVVPGKPHGSRFAGEPIVIVRTLSGTLFALEDRCAHRQVPLHAGVVEGETLQCCYHRWTYDATGRCVSVPYRDVAGRRLPNGVRSYPCREANGMIFIFPGATRRAPDVALPRVPGFGDPAYKTRYLDRRVKCHYTFMHENLMDMNHQFLHRRLMGGIRTMFLDMRTAESRIEVDYTFARDSGRQPFGERFMIGGAGKAGSGSAQDLMTICTDYPYQSLQFWRGGQTLPAISLWNVYVPQDREQRTNRTFGLMNIRRPSVPGLIHLLWPVIVWFTKSIFDEDQWIVEREQQAFDAQGRDGNQEIFPVIQGLRAILVGQGVPIAYGRNVS